MPNISVVVPIYNVEKYLACCIDSILNQTFYDYELILVNDGSTDDSGKICDEYAKKDNRIVVLHQQNSGVAQARNAGICISKGRYITFIDSDDYVLPDFLKVLYKGIVDNNADMSIVSKLDDVNDCCDNIYDGRAIIERFGNLNNYKFRSPWCKLVKTEIVKKNMFPIDRIYSEDMATVYKWMHISKRCVESSNQLYYYRINQSGITCRPYGKHMLKNIVTLEELISFFEKNKYSNLLNSFVRELLYDVQEQYLMASKDDTDTILFLRKHVEKIILKYVCKCNINLYCFDICMKIVSKKCMRKIRIKKRIHKYWNRYVIKKN